MFSLSKNTTFLSIKETIISMNFTGLQYSPAICPNVSQIPAGRDLTDELPTKSCFSIYYFPANEAPKPGFRVGAVELNPFRDSSLRLPKYT
jgi:hypothetical protein